MLIEPECQMGYTHGQLKEMLGDRLEEFGHWMRGQTMAICGGPNDGYGEGNCAVPHGAPIVYPWDLQRFLARLPIID